MTKVLAVRTREGFYLEFATLHARTSEGQEVTFTLDDCPFVDILNVDPPPQHARQETSTTNGAHRKPAPTEISGAGAIKSEERVHGD